ncbi:MAG: acetyl-CoA acetyltransferase [Pseudomonadales bacterium]|nr:acetyl-CoA acetyltransferase [Pseudomonadales bacterium]
MSSSTKSVYILGGHQTDYSRNWARESLEIADLMEASVLGALDDASLDVADIGVVHIGNFIADLFCGQGLLGGVLVEKISALAGLPTNRHEAACASGSMAALAAMADIESGRYDLACVLGVEQMRNVHGDTAAQYLGAAAWRGHEAEGVKYCWPHMFHQLTDEYHKRYGINYDHVVRIAEINYENGRRNPNSQTRTWQFNEQSFTADDEANPIIDGWVRRNDCGQVTDGGACVLLASEGYARQYASKRGLSLEQIPKIQGWGHRTAPISYGSKVAASEDKSLIFPHVRQTIDDAFGRAGVANVAELSAIETHDCFAITEYMAIDHFGITAPGESWKAVEEGVIAFEGTLPINPSGGLIGTGHPVGATGVRMLLDAAKQVSGNAGEYQVPKANKVATLNIGGSTTATACFVVGTN